MKNIEFWISAFFTLRKTDSLHSQPMHYAEQRNLHIGISWDTATIWQLFFRTFQQSRKKHSI